MLINNDTYQRAKRNLIRATHSTTLKFHTFNVFCLFVCLFFNEYQGTQMANAIPQEIKKDLQCYICSGELKDPVDLPCLHAFCFECLHTWHQASQDKKQVICPNCKEAATVPREGIHGLPVHSSTKDLKMEQLYKHTVSFKCIQVH